MIREETKFDIDSAIGAELENCKKYGEKYNTDSEAWAVLKEEVEEVREAIKENDIDNFIEFSWACVRSGREIPENAIKDIQKMIKQRIYEEIQVIAVLEKWKKGVEK